jgi:hypothetical protein
MGQVVGVHQGAWSGQTSKKRAKIEPTLSIGRWAPLEQRQVFLHGQFENPKLRREEEGVCFGFFV